MKTVILLSLCILSGALSGVLIKDKLLAIGVAGLSGILLGILYIHFR